MSSLEDDRYWVGPAKSPDTYQLISPLGGGGEGEVWKGVVPLSESGRGLVAIKILPPNEGEDQGSWSRYSHLLRSLDHPGLVRVIDVFLGSAKHRAGTVEATEVDTTEVPAAPGMHRYVVMKLVEGVTLREWLDENPEAPISHRLRALMMVASALDEMHSGRQTGVPVAHGDVKPSNIIMREDGSSVLVDLGLTRIADGQGRTGRSRPYAAPELFVPGAVTTPEADRFAFVATLVHAALGETPPTAEGRGPDIEAVAALMGRNPMTARRPLLTNGVLAALQSAPEGRPTPLATWLASLTDTLSQTTQPYSGPGSPTATPPKPRIGGRRLRLALAGAALVVLLLTASIGYALTRGGPPPVPTSAGQTQPAAAAAIAPSRTPGPVDSSPAASESPSPLLSPSDGAGPSDSAGPQPAVEPGADYFADGSKFRATDGTSFSTDPTNLNGQFYTQNLRFWVSHTGSKGSATFVLGRHYSRLKTVVGVDDSATSNLQVRIEIVADNVSIFRKDLAKGTAVTVDVPVTNIYSVNFSITELGGSAGYGVFADARVLR